MNNDLISRSALIKEINENHELFEKERVYLEGIVLNAPTAAIDNYAMGYQDGVRKVLSERPKGKIVLDHLPYTDNEGVSRTFERYICSECKCGIPSIAKFCWHCGADLTGVKK